MKEGKQPLYIVYPIGSLAISDAPLGFLPHGSDSAAKEATFKELAGLSAVARGPGQGRGDRPPADDEHRALAARRRPEGLQPGLGRPGEPEGADDHLPGGAGDREGARQLPARLPPAGRHRLLPRRLGQHGLERRLERRRGIGEAALRPGGGAEIPAPDRPDRPDDRARLLGHDQPRQDRGRQRRRRPREAAVQRSRRRGPEAVPRSTTASRRRRTSSRPTPAEPGRS